MAQSSFARHCLDHRLRPPRGRCGAPGEHVAVFSARARARRRRARNRRAPDGRPRNRRRSRRGRGTHDGRGARASERHARGNPGWDAGYGFVDAQGGRPFQGQGYRIPSLHELLRDLPAVRFNVDLKSEEPALVERFIAIVREHQAEDRVIAASFFRSTLFIAAPRRVAWRELAVTRGISVLGSASQLASTRHATRNASADPDARGATPVRDATQARKAATARAPCRLLDHQRPERSAPPGRARRRRHHDR